MHTALEVPPQVGPVLNVIWASTVRVPLSGVEPFGAAVLAKSLTVTEGEKDPGVTDDATGLARHVYWVTGLLAVHENPVGKEAGVVAGKV
jgi:hypothetical protein